MRITTKDLYRVQSIFMVAFLLFPLNLSAQMCVEISLAAEQVLQSRQQRQSQAYLEKLAANMPSKGSRLIMNRIIYEAFNLPIPKSNREKQRQITVFGDKWESSCRKNYDSNF